MALFGGMGAPEQIMAQGGMPMMPKRKNPLFGALSGAGKWLGGESGTPGINRIQTIGAGLKDIGGAIDGGDSDNLMNLQLLAQRRQQAEAQQGWQQEQQARQRQEWQQADAESEALNNGVSSLPPDRQMMARALPKEALKAEFERMKPKDPEYRTVGRDLVMLGPDGVTPIYRAPKDTGVDGPSITELRQFGNAYNDDTRAINNDMGNSRAAIPYANAVLASRGNPPSGFNARMSDIQLLRAAARAQTGPGVLTESEVFGTLSPGLQQEIRNKGAYFNPEAVTLTPQDRVSLAKNIQQGASQGAGDLWRLYDSTTNVLRGQGVDPIKAGVNAPEYPHPEDMPALNSSLKRYEVGKQYQGPTGRIYKYAGPGRWKFVRQEEPAYYNKQNGGTAQPGAAKRIRLEP